MNEKDLEELKSRMAEHPEYYEHELGERKIEDLKLTDFDFQGWLIPNLTLRRMLENLGIKVDEKNNTLSIDNSNPLLDKVPEVMVDDGMGYGGYSGNITHCFLDDEENKIKIWI